MNDSEFEQMARDAIHSAGWQFEGANMDRLYVAVTVALRTAYQAGMEFGKERSIISDVSGRTMYWAHSGPCQPGCTCAFARAAGIGG